MTKRRVSVAQLQGSSATESVTSQVPPRVGATGRIQTQALSVRIQRSPCLHARGSEDPRRTSREKGSRPPCPMLHPLTPHPPATQTQTCPHSKLGISSKQGNRRYQRPLFPSCSFRSLLLFPRPATAVPAVIVPLQERGWRARGSLGRICPALPPAGSVILTSHLASLSLGFLP